MPDSSSLIRNRLLVPAGTWSCGTRRWEEWNDCPDGFYPCRWSSKGRGRLQPAFCNLWVPVGKESIFSWPREGFLSSGLSRIDKDGIDPMSISFPQATPERCLCISTVWGHSLDSYWKCSHICSQEIQIRLPHQLLLHAGKTKHPCHSAFIFGLKFKLS